MLLMQNVKIWIGGWVIENIIIVVEDFYIK